MQTAGTEFSFNQAIDLYAPPPSSCRYDFLTTPNLWPSRPEEYQEEMEQYIKIVVKVGNALMRCMAIAFSLPENYFEPYTSDSNWICRIIGYPPLPVEKDAEDGVSCGEHTDYGCWTFLLTDDT